MENNSGNQNGPDKIAVGNCITINSDINSKTEINKHKKKIIAQKLILN